ncbi:MAG: polysaccharide deacetylase family protein [Brotaphodocola sp.]
MKKWNKILIASLTAAMLAAQPVWADTGVALVGPGMVQAAAQENSGSPVIVAGASGAEVSETGSVTAAESDSVTVVDENREAQPAASAAGPGAAAPTSSNVIVAGQGQAQMDGQIVDVSGETETVSAEEAAASEEAAAEEQTGENAEQVSEESAQTEASGRQIDPSRPMVALTYDDGPQPSVGNRIMDCLAKYGGKATFFLVGERVPGFASEVQRMAAEGHEVANHTQNHVYLQKASAGTIQSQVAQCNATLLAASGVTPALMRLPGGNHNATVRSNVNMPMIQWSIDTLDWKTRNADATVNAVLSQVKDGDIVLMHELYSQTADATERIVPELVNRGFQLVTVSEMAAAKGRGLQAGQIYSAFR